jgi:hypothetical protein
MGCGCRPPPLRLGWQDCVIRLHGDGSGNVNVNVNGDGNRNKPGVRDVTRLRLRLRLRSRSRNPMMTTLNAPLLWLTTKRASADGRKCRDYVVYDAAGVTLLTARAFVWSRDIAVLSADGPGEPVMVLRRRHSFPLTGKVDVYEAAGRRRLGVVSRSGRFVDADGRRIGRFSDARSVRARALEGVLASMVEAMLDGNDAMVSGPSGYVLALGGRVAGTLGQMRLPFETEAEAGPAGGVLRRLVPERARRLLPQRGGPRGWKLERAVAELPCDPRLYLAAALFAVELSYW